MRAPSDPTSDVGKPILRVPRSKLSFTSWMKLSIAGEGEVTLKRRIDQKPLSSAHWYVTVDVAILYSGLFWIKKLVKQQSREDVQMSLPSERRPPLENRCTVIYSASSKTVYSLLPLPPLLFLLPSCSYYKGADLFQKGGRTKKQAAGRGTSRYSIGIKSWPELISN